MREQTTMSVPDMKKLARKRLMVLEALKVKRQLTEEEQVEYFYCQETLKLS